MPTIEVNGIGLYYELRGRGEPLVVILGLGLDLSEAEWLIAALAQDFQVLCFDNRGAGRSDKPDEKYSVEMMAVDTAGLMDAVGIASASVLGISMGGRIALELALEHPAKVRRLVLVSTCARVLPNWKRKLILDLSSRLPLSRGQYPQPHYAFVRQRQASEGYDASRRIKSIAVPTLILHGQSDRLAPLKLAEEMESSIKDSRILTFSGGHLFFLLGERERFLRAVTEFLRA